MILELCNIVEAGVQESDIGTICNIVEAGVQESDIGTM